jgi:hypothetical protein
MGQNNKVVFKNDYYLNIGFGNISVLQPIVSSSVGKEINLSVNQKVKVSKRFEFKNGLGFNYRNVLNYLSNIHDLNYDTSLTLKSSFQHYLIKASSFVQYKTSLLDIGLGLIPSLLLFGTFNQTSDGPDSKYNGLYNIKQQNNISYFNKVNVELGINVDFRISKQVLLSFTSYYELLSNPINSQFNKYNIFTNTLSINIKL